MILIRTHEYVSENEYYLRAVFLSFFFFITLLHNNLIAENSYYRADGISNVNVIFQPQRQKHLIDTY